MLRVINMSVFGNFNYNQKQDKLKQTNPNIYFIIASICKCITDITGERMTGSNSWGVNITGSNANGDNTWATNTLGESIMGTKVSGERIAEPTISGDRLPKNLNDKFFKLEINKVSHMMGKNVTGDRIENELVTIV